MNDYEQIVATLDQYAHAYCAKDIHALMQVFDSTNSVSVIGTGNDELCCGQNEVKDLFLRNFFEASATQFEWGWSDVVISNDHAVVAQCLTLHLSKGELEFSVPIRWSIMLKKTSRWVWVHRHASTASTAQSDGHAYPHSAK
ncbi:nuclear transport factor 2 family protein [Vibrio cionasavignyae]|uniref:nuclear transport factor 2 family protein n=1 Tax=Vibrio cionasavignyae TaxID=2910252 RepID=UPI003D123046